MKEQWKSVKDYEDYEVSNFGRVKSLERLDSRGHRRKEKLMSPVKTEDGYLYVRLSKNGVKEHFYINRLVWQTFVGEIPPKWDVNHLDENKENNHLENLDACSHGDNMNWATRNARSAAARSKPVEAIDKITGRVVYIFPSTAEAGRQGFNQGNVAACCRNCFNRPGNNIYKGFIWKYKEN